MMRPNVKVILADALGMCFGVRDALREIAGVDRPSETTIYGELVHNPLVIQNLSDRGFVQLHEHERCQVPGTPSVLITAHGISNHRRQQLQAAGKRLIDTTCPLVRRVHEAAQDLARRGYHVLILGKQGHVEVQGIVEDLSAYDVIGRVDEVCSFPHVRLGIVCQTTLPPQLADELIGCIRQCNPAAEIVVCDTICEPTRRRQQAIESLITQVQAIVVIGGKNSNNTLQLVAFCDRRGIPALHVGSVADLDRTWLAKFEVVGLTAGTSTLNETIDEVHQALANFTSSSKSDG